LVFHSSTIAMMHGPINIRCTKLFVDFLSNTYAKYIERLRFRITENSPQRLRFRITENSPQEKWISADGCGFQNADKDFESFAQSVYQQAPPKRRKLVTDRSSGISL